MLKNQPSPRLLKKVQQDGARGTGTQDGSLQMGLFPQAASVASWKFHDKLRPSGSPRPRRVRGPAGFGTPWAPRSRRVRRGSFHGATRPGGAAASRPRRDSRRGPKRARGGPEGRWNCSRMS